MRSDIVPGILGSFRGDLSSMLLKHFYVRYESGDPGESSHYAWMVLIRLLKQCS